MLYLLQTIQRIPVQRVLNASKGKRPIDIKIDELLYMRFGVHKVQVSAVEQLVHTSQLRAIGYAIHYAGRYIDGQRSIMEICRQVLADIREKGLDCLSDREARGDFAEFRSLRTGCDTEPVSSPESRAEELTFFSISPHTHTTCISGHSTF
jgi:hypothetical protein